MRVSRKTRRNSAAFIAGALCGAALTALLDGRSGAARRNWIRGKFAHGATASANFAGKQVVSASRHVGGTAAEYWAMMRDQILPNDILLARVRAQLGHVCSLNHVEMDVRDGHVTVWGNIPSAEAVTIGRRLRKTRGVATYYVQAEDKRNIRELSDDDGIRGRERLEHLQAA